MHRMTKSNGNTNNRWTEIPDSQETKVWRKELILPGMDLEKLDDILYDLYHNSGNSIDTRTLRTNGNLDFTYVYKYKTVDKRVRPVPAIMPEEVKVRRNFPEDPLHNLSPLPHHPPEFIPTTRITQERMDTLGIEENEDLTEDEKKLLRHIIAVNGRSIAFEEQERGTFRQDYFSDYQIPVTEHVPWMEMNISLPP